MLGDLTPYRGRWKGEREESSIVRRLLCAPKGWGKLGYVPSLGIQLMTFLVHWKMLQPKEPHRAGFDWSFYAQSFYFTVCATFFLKTSFCPAGVAQWLSGVVERGTHAPRSHQLDCWSGHIPRFWANLQWWGACRRQPIDFLPHPCFYTFLPLPSSL
uniref:Uncharacterized protein n=1 Tax=Molossus molossus TaxID=27622 RepID=A0A7J8C8J8_MOLMO|nr:hypothetical protein HJG59_009870 [Molossus molossus]